jgi:hypothetical protein
MSLGLKSVIRVKNTSHTKENRKIAPNLLQILKQQTKMGN